MKVFKRLLSILLTISILITMSTNVLATSVITDVDITSATMGDTTMESWISELLGMVQSAGIAVAMGMLLYVGIKYTLAAANEKADLKTASIRYITGAIILFSLSACFEIVKKVMTELDGAF